MRRLELVVGVSLPAELAHELALLVELQNPLRAVSVGHVDVAVGADGGLRWTVRVLLAVDSDGGGLRESHQDPTVQRGLGDLTGAGIGDEEKLLTPRIPEREPVGAWELGSPAAQESPRLVVDEHVVPGLIRTHDHPAPGVHHHLVTVVHRRSGLIRLPPADLRPVPVAPLTQDLLREARTASHVETKGRIEHCATDQEGGAHREFAASQGCRFHDHAELWEGGSSSCPGSRIQSNVRNVRLPVNRSRHANKTLSWRQLGRMPEDIVSNLGQVRSAARTAARPRGLAPQLPEFGVSSPRTPPLHERFAARELATSLPTSKYLYRVPRYCRSIPAPHSGGQYASRSTRYVVRSTGCGS